MSETWWQGNPYVGHALDQAKGHAAFLRNMADSLVTQGPVSADNAITIRQIAHDHENMAQALWNKIAPSHSYGGIFAAMVEAMRANACGMSVLESAALDDLERAVKAVRP